MRIAYLDCFAGVSGDMFLGALLDAGVPPQILQDAVKALNLNATLKIETVDRSGISCTKVHVLEGSHLAEELAQTHSHKPSFEHQRPQNEAIHTHQPKTRHLHKTGHPQSHDHS